jgi:hypothetical protein
VDFLHQYSQQYPSTGYRIVTDFHWSEYVNCYQSLKRQATDWVDGYGLYYGDQTQSFDGQCFSTYAQYAQYWPPQDVGFTTGSETAVTFSGGIDFVVLSVSAQSGYSTNVEGHWNFTPDGKSHVLCGNDAFPPSSHRVFAGPQT